MGRDWTSQPIPQLGSKRPAKARSQPNSVNETTQLRRCQSYVIMKGPRVDVRGFLQSLYRAQSLNSLSHDNVYGSGIVVGHFCWVHDQGAANHAGTTSRKRGLLKLSHQLSHISLPKHPFCTKTRYYALNLSTTYAGLNRLRIALPIRFPRIQLKWPD